MTRTWPAGRSGAPSPATSSPASSRTRAASSPTMYRGRLWTMRQYAGFGTAAESNARYRYLLSQGVSGLSVAFDLPTQMGYDSDHPLAAGEVGPRRRRDRLDRGHGGALRRHPARSRVDVDDDQRDGHHPAGALRRGRAAPGRAAGRALGHDPERHPQGVHRARHLHLSAAPFAAHRHRHLRVVRRASCRTGTRSRSAGTTSARPDRRRCRKWRSRSPTRSPTSRRRAPPAWTSNRLGPAPVVLLRRAQRLPRGDRQVPRRAPALGAHHARPLRRHRRRARCSCAFTRRRPAARSPRSSPTTTSCASRCRRWRPCSAARSRSTATAATRRWRCRPRRRRGSRCGRSRSSRPRRASPTPSIRSAARGRSSSGPTRSSARRARSSTRSTRPAARSRRSSAAAIQRQIQDAAYAAQQAIDRGEQVIVGVNRYDDRRAADRSQLLRIDPDVETRGRPRRSRRSRQARDAPAWQARARRPSIARRATARNLVPPVIAAVEARATLGEIADALRRVFGEHRDATST